MFGIVIVPVFDAEGTPHSAETFLAFETHALSLFSSISLDAPALTATWRRNAGVRYWNVARCYVMAVGSIEHGWKLVTLARFALVVFSEEEIAIGYGERSYEIIRG